MAPRFASRRIGVPGILASLLAVGFLFFSITRLETGARLGPTRCGSESRGPPTLSVALARAHVKLSPDVNEVSAFCFRDFCFAWGNDAKDARNNLRSSVAARRARLGGHVVVVVVRPCHGCPGDRSASANSHSFPSEGARLCHAGD